MPLPNAGLLLAGFILAHSAWSVSDLPKGELLTPLAIVQQGGQRSLTRFEAKSQAEAITSGKAAMARLGSSVDAWAFARDGLIRESGAPVSVLTIDFWAKGMKSPATIVQRYEPFATRGKFRILGEPMFVIQGVVQQPKAAKPWIATVLAGIKQHPKASPLWSSWR